VVGYVDQCVDLFETDEIAFHPFAKCKIFNIDMTSRGCGLFSIPHCSAPVVIFIGNCCHFLRNIEVPENAADKVRHAADVTSCHKFGFVVDRVTVG
jgi:hypothetical protein